MLRAHYLTWVGIKTGWLKRLTNYYVNSRDRKARDLDFSIQRSLELG